MKNFSEFGIKVPEILLPKNRDLGSWSVIACDQYTQDEGYWKKAAEACEGKPSTLNIILPEVYLSSPDRKERIQKIRKTMSEYISSGVFDEAKSEFIYVERMTEFGRKRRGLVCAIDLDSYEWKPFSKALVRATEATIVDRIPPRKEIRMNAPLELPHIMLLVNDREKKLVEGCGDFSKKNAPVYDGDLMLSSGHITGWALDDEEMLSKVYGALSELKAKNTKEDGSCFLFAVGDGNHSLATAKAVWEEYRDKMLSSGLSAAEVSQSPVRYALVEIVNLYDEGLTFEPIHRVLFNCCADALIKKTSEALGGEVSFADTDAELEQKVRSSSAGFGFVYKENGVKKYAFLNTPVKELAVSRLQPVLDEFISENSGVEIDYIHGSSEVFRLAEKDGAVSVMLPPVQKDSFFETIGSRGPLPRKSFSMGEASEKRFYLECRKLFDC